jgi:putative SOS response-associated peptidase YedK
MCGRLNQFAKIPALALAGRALRVERRKVRAGEDKKSEVPVINNICPTDYADVLTMDGGDLGVERMRFGLVPNWAKGSKAEVSKKFAHTFNARCESVFDLASYRRPILQRRCLIPVRGWHEWPDRQTPYFIHRADDAPLLLAGIWDVWESHDSADKASGPVVTSMSVITTPPGRYMGKFHDRSPLILEGDTAMNWLQAGMQADDIRAFFKPYESEYLEAYRVATLANQARNKTEAVFAPIAPPVPQEGDGPVEAGDAQDDESPGLKLF